MLFVVFSDFIVLLLSSFVAAAVSLCMLCRNLVSPSSTLVDEEGNGLLKCSVIFEKDLDFANDEDIKGTIQRLAAAKLSLPAGKFEIYCQAVGFNHEPHGILMDADLRDVVFPASQFCHDYTHGIFVNGDK